MQVKLLRALQESEFERVGGIKTIKVDVRLVAATNRDLEQEIAARQLPRGPVLPAQRGADPAPAAARARASDIPLLVEHFIDKFNERLKKQIAGIEPTRRSTRARRLHLARQHPRARERDRAHDAVLRGPTIQRVGPAGGVRWDWPAPVAPTPPGRAAAAPPPQARAARRRRRRPTRPTGLAPSSLKEVVRAETSGSSAS